MSTNTGVQEVVEAKIQNGSVVMRPRSVFVTISIAVIAFASIALVAGILSLSLAFFSIHEGGELFLLGFGAEGVLAFLFLFPWLPIILTGIALIVIEQLLRRFTRAYRYPLLLVFGCLLLGSLVLGLLIVPVHSALFEAIEDKDVPILGQWYEDVYASHGAYGVYRGAIGFLSDERMRIVSNDTDADADDRVREIILPEETSTDDFAIGQWVIVAGHVEGEHIRAYGIHTLPRSEI